MPWSSLEGPAKVLVICVVVLLVSSGLCGLQVLFAGSLDSDSPAGFFIVLGVAELAGIVGSVLVAVVTLIFWGLIAVSNRVSRKDGDDQP